MIPVMSPAAGGTPEAIAMPMQRGSATRQTTTDDSRSCANVPFSPETFMHPGFREDPICRNRIPKVWPELSRISVHDRLHLASNWLPIGV